MTYPVIIDGFEGQRIEVKGGGMKGYRVLVNGEVVPTSKKREMTLRRNDGKEVIAKFKQSFLGIGVPNLIVGGKKIQVSEPLKWYVLVWCYVSVPLVFIGGALGAFFSLLACGINTNIFRSSMNSFLKYFLSLIVSLVSVTVYFTLGYFITQALK